MEFLSGNFSFLVFDSSYGQSMAEESMGER